MWVWMKLMEYKVHYKKMVKIENFCGTDENGKMGQSLWDRGSIIY